MNTSSNLNQPVEDVVPEEEVSPELRAAIEQGLRSIEEGRLITVTREEMMSWVRKWAGVSK